MGCDITQDRHQTWGSLDFNTLFVAGFVVVVWVINFQLSSAEREMCLNKAIFPADKDKLRGSKIFAQFVSKQTTAIAQIRIVAMKPSSNFRNYNLPLLVVLALLHCSWGP